MQRVLDFLHEHHAETVAIFSHVRGDGDCLGAQTGLAGVLREAGFAVTMVNQEALSPNFAFLPDFDAIAPYDAAAPVPDVCISVDCANQSRIGELPQALLDRPWINIDHHVSNVGFGDLSIVESTASSTCEILARMIYAAGITPSAASATALYTGISTDTGSFLYQSATARTFETAARLLRDGADKRLVQQYIYENTSRKQIEIYKYLYSHLVFRREGGVAYCVFSMETLDALAATALDLEGVVGMIREIQGVEVAALFSEAVKGQCKLSLRSGSWFDCNVCCGRFGGGGHVRASGATITAPIEEAVAAVLEAIDAGWEEADHAS